MTMRYAHLSENFKKEAVKLLDEMKDSPKIGTVDRVGQKAGFLTILKNMRAGGWIRTTDLLITNQLLYH